VASLQVTSINLPGGATIRDGGGNNLNLSLSAVPAYSGPQIDTTIPAVTAIAETPSTGDLNAGKAVSITLSVGEAVTVTGTPTLTLSDNGTATYSRISTDGKMLTFSYTVGSADTNVASLQVTSLNLPGGATIRDGGGNNLNVSLSAVPTYSGPQIDTTIPAVTTVAEAPSTGNLSVGSTVTITLTVGEAVTVTGAPTLTLNDQGTATYTGISSNGKTLTFTYTVKSTDSSVPSLQVSSINLPGGATIRDGGGNNLNLSLSGVPTYSGPQISPTIVINTIAGDNIVNASEASAGFTITGTTTGVQNGRPVTVKILNASNATVDSYTTTVSQGTWSVSVTSAQGKKLTDGSYTVTADVSNSQGVPAPEANRALLVDTDASESPTITLTGLTGGIAVQGTTITANVSVPDNDLTPATTYNWQVSSNGGKTWTTVQSSTSNIYQPTDTSEGDLLQVSISATDTAGNTLAGTSATAPINNDPAPLLAISNLTPTVPAGGSIPMGISATPFDSDDQVSVTIGGVPSFENITAPTGDVVTSTKDGTFKFNGKTYTTYSYSVTAPTGQAVNGLMLTSSFTGTGKPVNTFTITASNLTTGETSASASQSINVTDPLSTTPIVMPPSPSVGLTAADYTPPSSPPDLAQVAALFTQFVAAGFPGSNGMPITGALSEIVKNEQEFLTRPHV